jgi:hypothetical protein
MRDSPYPDGDPDGVPFATSPHAFARNGSDGKNSLDEVVGEMGLVLIVVLGVIVVINLMLVAFHIG